jgi:DNA-binding response OmpR family regulator
MDTLEVAVRLADEGVPLRAIARATCTPSEHLREQLHEARSDGRLLDLPKEDWPPGFPRDQRALELSRVVDADREGAKLAIQRVFKLTVTEASLLVMLLQNANISRERLAMPSFDVHICHIRSRLARFGVTIETLRSYGYCLPEDGRRKILGLIGRGSGARRIR